MKRIATTGLLAVALLLAGAAGPPPDDEVLAPRDGGVCVGIAWATLASDERASVHHGPDFDVYRVEKAGGPGWGIYIGMHPAVEGNGPLLLRRDGVEIRRALPKQGFAGYVGGREGGALAHFFGALFDGSKRDKRAFERFDFSPAGKALCARTR